jgi:hypothetical protein
VTYRIQADGLRDLIRDYRRAGDSIGKQVAKANKAFVNRVAVPAAKANARGRTNPRAGRAVEASIRGLGSQTRAQMAGGGKKVPHYAGHEFGSVRFKQFPARSPRRGRGNAGYIMYPAVYDNIERLRDAYADTIDALLRAKG